MRLVYFGSGAFGLPTLERLASDHTLLGIVTQPDKPAGRGAKQTPTPIAAWAAEHLHGVPVFKPAKVNDDLVVQQIRALGADAWVVIAFGQKLSRGLLDGVFAINLHASLLPRWRGAAPINAAILGGDTTSGNTVITLADRMDAGLILGHSTRAIDPMMTAGELHDLLSLDGPDLVEQVLREFAMETLAPRPQQELEVTIATKLSKQDDAIDFHQSADSLRRQVHALTPWPGITAALHADPPATFKLLRVRVAEPRAGAADEPGTLIDVRQGLVSCGRGTTLQILDVQPPGKKPMPWPAFANGRTIAPRTVLTSARDVD